MNSDAPQHTESHEAGGRNGTSAEGGNVDRIRDILFGPQMRDYDGRFQRLEERLNLEANALRTDVQKRLEAIESFAKGEFEAMSNRVKAEQSERGQAVEKLARDLVETAKAIESKLGHLDERAGKDLRDLRQQLLEQSKSLSAEFKDRHDQIKARLENEARLIRGAMTGRESLAEMLHEIALRLKGEFHVPGGH